MVSTRSGSSTASNKPDKEKKTSGKKRRRSQEESPTSKRIKTRRVPAPTVGAEVLDIHPPKPGKSSSDVHKITINRAPVMTLFAAVCLHRTGDFSWPESLSLANACAALNAQSKGRSLGIYKPKDKSLEEGEEEHAKRKAEEDPGATKAVEVLGRPVMAVCSRTEENTKKLKEEDLLWLGRAGSQRKPRGRKPKDPAYVSSYLKRKFGDSKKYAAAFQAMDELAATLSSKEELTGRTSYELYEEIRPAWKGWGRPSVLDIDGIRQLAKERRSSKQ